jgi:hypothetical protein
VLRRPVELTTIIQTFIDALLGAFDIVGFASMVLRVPCHLRSTPELSFLCRPHLRLKPSPLRASGMLGGWIARDLAGLACAGANLQVRRRRTAVAVIEHD